jgi:hypothetical protein
MKRLVSVLAACALALALVVPVSGAQLCKTPLVLPNGQVLPPLPCILHSH